MIPRRRGLPRARWPRSTRHMLRSRVAASGGRARAADRRGRPSSKSRRGRDAVDRRDRSPRGRSPEGSTRRGQSGLGTHRFALTAPTAGRAPRRPSAARPRSGSPRSIASLLVPATRPAHSNARGSETSGGRHRRRSTTPWSASSSSAGSAATPSARSRRSSRPTLTGSPGRSPGIPSLWPPRGSSRRTSIGGGLPGAIESRSGTTQARRPAAPPERPRPLRSSDFERLQNSLPFRPVVRFRSPSSDHRGEAGDFARRAKSEESPFEVGPKPSERGDRPPMTGRRPNEREMIRAISPTVTRTGPAGRMIRSYSARDLGRDPRHLNRHQVNRRPTVDP